MSDTGKPLGTGKGALVVPTKSDDASTKGTDFTANPNGGQAKGEGHDFARDPSGKPLTPKPEDPLAAQRAQPKGPLTTINPRSVPDGGRLPFKGAPQPTSSGRPPFKGLK